MWISKKRWDALNERLEALEKKVPGQPYTEPLTFTVYDQNALKRFHSAGIWDYRGIPHQTLSLKDAIEKILSHLKIELTYNAGTPATVEIQKRSS